MTTRAFGVPYLVNKQIIIPSQSISHASKTTTQTSGQRTAASTQPTGLAFPDNLCIATFEVSPNQRVVTCAPGKIYNSYEVTYSMKRNQITFKSKLGGLEYTFPSGGIFYLDVRSGKLIITKKG